MSVLVGRLPFSHGGDGFSTLKKEGGGRGKVNENGLRRSTVGGGGGFGAAAGTRGAGFTPVVTHRWMVGWTVAPAAGPTL